MIRGGYMDMDKINSTNDLNQLYFYLDYVDQIIEMYNKRGISTVKLKEEKEMIEKRINEVGV
jgi:catabolite regulation protein CreA